MTNSSGLLFDSSQHLTLGMSFVDETFTRATCCLAAPAQLMLNPKVEHFLIDEVGPTSDLEVLNPNSAGGASVTIIVCITIVYTDNNAVDPTEQLTKDIDTIMNVDDWQDNCGIDGTNACVVFENTDIRMIAPAMSQRPGIVSIQEVTEFTAAGTNITVILSMYDLRCANGEDCSPSEVSPMDLDDLDNSGSGISFGVVDQSIFNNGLCTAASFDDPYVAVLLGQSFDWSGEDRSWYK